VRYHVDVDDELLELFCQILSAIEMAKVQEDKNGNADEE
jgi:hypothetical protein